MTDPPVELPIRTLTDESDAPKHQQLREILEDVCINYLNPGDMLPGERVLEEQYGVSRITVRRAIGDLVASGKLRRARGKGTFVAHSPLVARVHLASFSDEMAAQNITSSSKILLSAWTTAPEEIRIFFNSPLTKPFVLELFISGNAAKGMAYNTMYLGSLLVSGAILAGGVGYFLVISLARTGALDRFAVGRERRAVVDA